MTPILRRSLAVALILGTSFTFTVAPLAAGAAVFTGRVFDSDGVTARSGVVVTLVGSDGDQVYRSRPTNDEGAFKIESAPAGAYTLLADTEEGAYLADGSLELEAGGNRPLALTIGAAAGPNYQTGPGGSSAGSPGGDGLPKWARWTIAGALGVAAILLIDDATEDNEPSASDF